MADIHRRKTAAATLSVASNVTLVALKLAVGIWIGSVSVISEAAHSGVDLMAAIIALFAVRTAGRPPDKRHPYGHGKIENVSGTVEALLIFAAAAWIIYEAVEKLFHPSEIANMGWGVGVMLTSAVFNLAVSQYLFKVGRETDSVALTADGWHLRTDVYTSAGVMGALGIIWIGSRLFPDADLHWIDPVAAIAVALLIVRAAYQLTIESGRDLLDVRLPEQEEDVVRACVARHEPDVIEMHGLKTRKAGSDRFVEMHLVLDRDLSVEDAHDITKDIEREIRERLRNATVTIHVDPSED